MFTISKWLHFCFSILTKINKTVKFKKIAATKNNIDYYIMMEVLFSASNRIRQFFNNLTVFKHDIVFFSIHEITMPAIFLRCLLKDF